MKKFLNVVKFFATNMDFIAFLLFAVVFGTVAAAGFTVLLESGFDAVDVLIVGLFSFASILSLVAGVKECAYQYREVEIRKYYAHIDNLVKSGEWARI